MQNEKQTINVKRGDLFYADLGSGNGSEQAGVRPVVIIQNNIGNRYSPTVIVASLTTQIKKKGMPTQVRISGEDYGMRCDSVIMLEQIRTLDKSKLKSKIGSLLSSDIAKVNNGLAVSLAL